MIGGIHAGYNYQIQSFVIGAETDINWTSIKGDDGGAGGMLDQTKLKWLGSLRGRLGYAWDRFLVFGTGGLEYAVDANWLVRADIATTISAPMRTLRRRTALCRMKYPTSSARSLLASATSSDARK